MTPPVPPNTGKPKPPFTPASSRDDLKQLQALDAAESRARAALALQKEADTRADEAAAEVARAKEHNAVLEEQLRLALRAPKPVVITETDTHTKSVSPVGISLGGKNWKVALPLTALLAIAPFLWTVVQKAIAIEQQLSDLNKIVAGYADSQDARDDTIAKLQGEVVTLRITQAKQSGYLAKVLPLAGVSVPGAELGAIDVDIDRDSEPLGTKHRPKIVTHTRVPAPAPTQ